MEERTINLLEYLQCSGKRQRLRMVKKLAQLFWSLERAGVYHRDLHLRNILVTPQESLILLDFDRALNKQVRSADVASMFLRLGRFLDKMERQGQLIVERKERELFLRLYDRLSGRDMSRRLQGGEMRRHSFHRIGWLIESFLYGRQKNMLLLFLPALLLFLTSCAFHKTLPGVKVGPEPIEQEKGYGTHGETTLIAGGGMGSFAGMTGGCESEVLRSREETNSIYGYVYDRGASARIESVRVRPTSAHPGGQVDLIVTYMVFSHSEEPVQVREVREVWFKDTLWESAEVEVQRAGGTYESRIPLYLPDRTAKGDYKVVSIVQTPYSRDLREAAFTVNGD